MGEHALQNLQRWFKNHPGAIIDKELHFLDEDVQNDLFPIVQEEQSPLRMLLGRWRWLRFRFTPQNTAGQVKHPTGTYTSETALDTLMSVIVVLVGLGLLMGTMWILHCVKGDMKRLSIVTGFGTAFTTLTCAATRHRPVEILVITAICAGVLMVS